MRGSSSEQRPAREDLVRRIYGLGLSAKETAELVEWSEATVVQDLKRLGGLKAFPKRPKPAQVFATVIRSYAEIMALHLDGKRQLSDEQNALRVALAAWLREDRIEALLQGLELAFERLTVPMYPEERHAHARLLGAVFRIDVDVPCNTEPWSYTECKRWWHKTLTAIHSGEEAAPTSHLELQKMLVRRTLDQTRDKIMPTWDESVFTQLDDALEALTEGERKVICERFGIGVKKAKTLRQIASDTNRSPERIRELEAHALKKLRTCDLQPYAKPLNVALQRELARRKIEEDAARQTKPEKRNVVPVLFREVDELKLSARAANALVNRNTTLIGELVQLTPRELMRTKNFGQKSFYEIRDALNRRGLILGMKVSDETKALLEKRKQELAEQARQDRGW